MNKREMFIKMVEELIGKEDNVEQYKEALEFFKVFKNSKDRAETKPKFTTNGKAILLFMQENSEENQNMFKSRNIAEGMFISSRSVSGSIRKLVTDGYVEKIGVDPIVYSLTDEGKNVKF